MPVSSGAWIVNCISKRLYQVDCPPKQEAGRVFKKISKISSSQQLLFALKVIFSAGIFAIIRDSLPRDNFPRGNFLEVVFLG